MANDVSKVALGRSFVKKFENGVRNSLYVIVKIKLETCS